jgi:hypothetical protein
MPFIHEKKQKIVFVKIILNTLNTHFPPHNWVKVERQLMLGHSYAPPWYPRPRTQAVQGNCREPLPHIHSTTSLSEDREKGQGVYQLSLEARYMQMK